jgi:TBC1 domain-containing protein 4
LCLISTDRHKVVLNKTFANISHCSQGVANSDHFGIICREPALNTPESYVIHVFMCQSERLVSEIMHSLKQAFSNAYQSSKQRTPYICDTCPMHWFHRLCADMEGLSGERAHAIIVNRVEGLPVRDRDECERLATPQGVVGGKQRNSLSIHEQNELLMSALKVLCERKQRRHQHSGGGAGSQDKSSLLEKRLSVHALDTFKEKARNSLSNTFESIFKVCPIDCTVYSGTA